MRKGYSVLFVFLLMMNSLVVFSSFTSAPVEALDYGMDTNLGNVNASFWGVDESGILGHSVAIVGDVNGDGYDDILIGIPCNVDGTPEVGQTYLIFGKGSDWTLDTNLFASDASFRGEHAGDLSGVSVAGAGDVNGDGYDDILIGAQYNKDRGVPDAGKTYLILGKATGWTMGTNLSASDASFLEVHALDRGRNSVSGVGDVNGDGYDDILIGAFTDYVSGGWPDQTYLIFGKDSGWAMDTPLSASDASFLGEDYNDNSGYSVSGVGDVNGDGYDDILIGAYGNDDNGKESGQTYLILGKPSGWEMNTNLSTSDASFLGDNAEDLSGCSIAGAGDVNGDGYDDILIRADGNDDFDNGTGQTYLILGKASGWEMDTNLSESDASFRGENAKDGVLATVAAAGDVNGDGYDDILIGAPVNDDGGVRAGQTYLILGKAYGWVMGANLSTSDVSFWGEDEGHFSGWSVAGGGDVNGDGYDDILIGVHKDARTYLIFPDHNPEPMPIISLLDRDGDGVPNVDDAFPDDGTRWEKLEEDSPVIWWRVGILVAVLVIGAIVAVVVAVRGKRKEEKGDPVDKLGRVEKGGDGGKG